MDHQSSPTSFPSTPIQTILTTGLVAGTIDLAAAVINSGAPIEKVLPYIASGAFGPSAFTGSWAMIGWGLLFHYFIAFFWTVVFFWIYPKLSFLSKNLIITGLLYGIIIWLCMNLLVLPLANAPKRPFDWASAGRGMLILMGMVGLPISLIIGRYYRRRKVIR